MATDELEQYEEGYSTVRLRDGNNTVFVSDECKIRFHGSNDLDEQRPTGKNKARLKHLGAILTRLTISFVLYAEDERNFWDNVYPLMREKNGRGNAPPLDFLNAQGDRAGITTVVVDDYDIGDANSRDGREVSIKFREWSPAPVKPKEDNSAKLQYGPPTLQQFIAQTAEVNTF